MLAAVRALRRETLLGFDTETRPSFQKGETHPPALIQLAGKDAVYLFHLPGLGLPAELTDLLTDARIVKAGVANDRDLRELRGLRDFAPRGFVDLGECAAAYGIPHQGLRGLAAVLLGCRISKGARFTNWERTDLDDRALQYAATDAWIGRRIYEALQAAGCLGSGPRQAESPSGPSGRGLWHRAKAALARAIGRTRRGTVQPKDTPAARHGK